MLDEAGEYSLSAYIRDEFGNIKVSENIIVELKDLIKSFPVAKFVEPDAGSMQVGSNFLLTATSSENFINNVEFFLDGRSLGFGERQHSSNYYTKMVDLKAIAEGPHEFSLVARDFLGNQVGTFSESLTNIDSKLNKTIRIRSASNVDLPTVELICPNSIVTSSSESYPTYNRGDIVNVVISGNPPQQQRFRHTNAGQRCTSRFSDTRRNSVYPAT